ncbi:MAG: diaminopimelate epimerase [Omnitrophica bacterium]|nr:diaminopimelate epimerase [Candidatus Omnitrophota bacterium]
MKIEFAKVQATGNDFIVVDNRGNRLGNKISDFGDFAKVSCRRKYSVGADGVLVLEDSKIADFKMRIINPDGSEVSMCGNGIRASAAFCYAKKWCGTSMKIETARGTLAAEIKGDSVKIKMTPPKNIRLERNVGLGNTIMDLHTLDTGVPHAVHFVEKIKGYPVKEMGAKLRYHKAFQPEGINADFVEAVDKSTISVRTYERGVEDETLACGTGAVASAIISCLVRGIGQPVSVVTAGGEVLKIYFEKEHNNFHDVYLEGKANISFEGGLDYV